MNQKHFIILFVLLILFEKTYGCHPAGRGLGDGCDPYNFQITDVKWLQNSQLSLTIYNNDAGGDPNLMVHAIGHYTFGGDKGHSHRFLQDPEFVNTHHCDDNLDTQLNPYTDVRSYDPNNAPVLGEWVGIWLQVYWSCNSNGRGGSVNCCSKGLFINTPYKPSAE